MKKIFAVVTTLMLTVAASAQTLNVTTDNVTYQFPAAQAGEMTYNDGTTLTILGKVFTLADISNMTVDNSEVTDNLVSIAYNGTSATVKIAGNVAQYVTASVSGAHVTIAQTNTEAVNNDEITYQLSGTSTDGSLTLGGSYKCTVSLAGVTLTNPSGAAINITNSKRIQLSAKKDTENTLTDGSGSQKACIYSKGQLQLQGNGTLNVAGKLKHAIKSASYISIKNLTLNIMSAVSDGINCEEYLQMKSGNVTIKGVGDDAIQCDLGGLTSTGELANHEDEDSGNIYIEGGTLNATADATAAKCIKSAGSITVSDGTIQLYANGAIDLTNLADISYTAGLKADSNITLNGGSITANVTGGAGRAAVAGGTFTMTDGTLTIVSSGATSNSGSSASTKYLCTAKGIKAGEVIISGGTINITTSGAASKGIKADSDDGSGNITISGGTINVKTTGAGAIDYSESDGKGCSGINADGDMTINGGTFTLTNTGTGGKGIKVNGILTINDGTINATSTGSNFTSGNYSASAKAIKAGVRTEVSSIAAFGPGGGGPGGGGPGGGGNNKTYTYSGGIVITGGTVIASASSHEAIESKSTIDISGGYVYAYSGDDAINAASDFTISGGYVMGNSSGNDGLDANGNFYIKGGNVFAVATTSPEVGIDANTEGGYKLYITGGNVIAIGGLESGSSLSGVTSKTASVTKGNWYSFASGGTRQFYFKVPSNSKQATSTTIVSTSTPSVTSASNITSNIWNGFGCTN